MTDKNHIANVFGAVDRIAILAGCYKQPSYAILCESEGDRDRMYSYVLNKLASEIFIGDVQKNNPPFCLTFFGMEIYFVVLPKKARVVKIEASPKKVEWKDIPF